MDGVRGARKGWEEGNGGGLLLSRCEVLHVGNGMRKVTGLWSLGNTSNSYLGIINGCGGAGGGGACMAREVHAGRLRAKIVG